MPIRALSWVICIKPVTREEEGTALNAKTTLELLADLEHEFWFHGDPVWLGITAREHEWYLPLSWSKARAGPDLVAGRSGNWFDCAANHRLDERSHVEPPRTSSTIFLDGSDSCQHCSLFHAGFL